MNKEKTHYGWLLKDAFEVAKPSWAADYRDKREYYEDNYEDYEYEDEEYINESLSPKQKKEFYQLQKDLEIKRKRIEDFIFNKIFSGEWFLYGFETPYAPDDKPVSINCSEVSNRKKMFWHSSHLEVNGIEYVNLFMTKRKIPKACSNITLLDGFNTISNSKIPYDRYIEGGTEKEKQSLTPQRRTGRPSFGRTIKAKYIQLKNENKINFLSPKKSVYEEIAHAVARDDESIEWDENRKQYTNLGYTAVERAVGTLFDSDKKGFSS